MNQSYIVIFESEIDTCAPLPKVYSTIIFAKLAVFEDALKIAKSNDEVLTEEMVIWKGLNHGVLEFYNENTGDRYTIHPIEA